MTGHSPKLNPVRTTLRRWRALFALSLRTLAGTVIILACGLYYINDTLLAPHAKPAAETADGAKGTARRPSLNKLPRAKTPLTGEMTDPLSLIKASKNGAAAAGKRTAAAGAGAPRLKTVTFAGSGGRFVPLGQDEPEAGQPGRAENARPEQEAVLLPAAALSKKVRVKGARPVPVLTGKKYSGIDSEAEFLRARVSRQAAAAEAARVQLRNEKLLLAGWLALLALAGTILSSRVIRAWRLIQKSEGTHWTLK